MGLVEWPEGKEKRQMAKRDRLAERSLCIQSSQGSRRRRERNGEEERRRKKGKKYGCLTIQKEKHMCVEGKKILFPLLPLSLLSHHLSLSPLPLLL